VRAGAAARPGPRSPGRRGPRAAGAPRGRRAGRRPEPRRHLGPEDAAAERERLL
jgi:hypothetical protein